jgi:hypothetical protein
MAKTLQAIFIVGGLIYIGVVVYVATEMMLYAPKCASIGGGC